MQLDTAEQQAISQFIQDNWQAFIKTAKVFMRDDEIEALGEKLADMG